MKKKGVKFLVFIIMSSYNKPQFEVKAIKGFR